MDRAERIGIATSGALHLGAILWLAVGGFFFRHDLPPLTVTSEVTLMSEAEYAALQAARPKAPVEAPATPARPQPPAAEAAPVPPAAEAAPQAPQPEAPQAQSAPDASPDVSAITPPEAAVEDTAPAAPQPPAETLAETLLPSPQPEPKAAPIVAPAPSPAPPENADRAPEAVTAAAPRPAEAAPQEKPAEAAAPPETGQVLKTEANRDQKQLASAAPVQSVRPKKKPAAKPAPAPAPAPPAPPVQAATPAPPAPPPPAPAAPPADAVADALAEALAGAEIGQPAPGSGTAPQGPPLTSGEKDALVIAVKQCWNVGALSTDALRTIVTIGVSMDQSGKPIAGSIRLIDRQGGTEASGRQAFEAGRRAILRCGQDGYPLPIEKYEQWREVEIVFNPERMRMK